MRRGAGAYNYVTISDRVTIFGDLRSTAVGNFVGATKIVNLSDPRRQQKDRFLAWTWLVLITVGLGSDGRAILAPCASVPNCLLTEWAAANGH